mmetsp:Transcript_24265/g.51229  ORF Transcript_24265/g.51229 Transcript_24265/m.51229 type:complete len:86 (+) Transcript_24265:161-418(+)
MICVILSIGEIGVHQRRACYDPNNSNYAFSSVSRLIKKTFTSLASSLLIGLDKKHNRSSKHEQNPIIQPDLRRRFLHPLSFSTID